MTLAQRVDATSTGPVTDSFSEWIPWEHFRFAVVNGGILQGENINKLQKGSPYLEDANYLMQLSLEMGLKFTDYQRNIGHYHHNFTACDTWNKVKASQKNKEIVVLQYDDFYGLFILLAVGLGLSSLAFIVEIATQKVMNIK